MNKKIQCYNKKRKMEDKSNGKSIIKNTFFEGYQINYNYKEKQLYFGNKFKGEGIEISPNKIEKLKKAEKILIRIK